MKASASLPDLVASALSRNDLEALAALEDHADKEVRKAARKALHVARTKGSDVPSRGPRTWVSGGLEGLRGDLRPAVDITITEAGLLQIFMSEPEPEGGAVLWAALLTGDGRIARFDAYSQSDGQRASMVRSWGPRCHEVDREWARTRIVQAYESTRRQGLPVPAALEQSLSRLWRDVPAERARPFVVVPRAEGVTAEEARTTLVQLGAIRWVPLLNALSILNDRRAAALVETVVAPDESKDAAEARQEGVLQTWFEIAKDDAAIVAACRGPLASVLEDCGLASWCAGDDDLAGRCYAMAEELRTQELGAVAWAPALIANQVFSQALHSGAFRDAIPEEDSHDHDHDHDGHHHHVHDENCRH